MDEQSQKDLEPAPVDDRRISINVLHMELMGNGKVKVRIKENQANLINMHHQGRDYIVIRNLGRGRYIMRLAA